MQEYDPKKEFILLNILSGIFVAVLVLSGILSSKIIAIGPLYIPGGVILFPLAFIFNDILTEVYGFTRSRRIIWTGLSCQLLATFSIILVGLLPSAPFWNNQEAYSTILGFVPRIFIGGMLAYFCGEFANSFVLSKMKYLQKGKRGLKQGWRFVASTIVGEGIDSIIVMSIAFFGVLAWGDFVRTTITLYLVKVAYEIIALPFSTRFANWVKRVEGSDKIDNPNEVDYNPFSFKNSKLRQRITPGI